MLDLGAVVGRVVLEDLEFQRVYVRVVQQMGTLGSEATSSAQGTVRLDEALAAVAASASTAAAGLGRTERASVGAATAEQKAAIAAERQAKALADVAATSARYTESSRVEQQAALRSLAAQERLTAARAEAGSVEQKQAAATAKLASAQAAAIGTADRLVVATSRSGTAFATAGGGMLRTAAQLGLIVGAFEAVKKVIDIGHETIDFQRDMLLIQTNAGASAADVKVLSAAVLGMAGDVAAAPEDLAVALYHVKSVAQDANGVILTNSRMLDIVRIAAEGARVGVADLEETTNALTSTVASGIGGVKNFSQAMGVLIAIVGVGDMHMSDLNAALGTGILARMRVFGVSIQETGAALAVFGDNNIRGADAATALRMAVQDVAKPAAHADDVLAGIGLTAQDLRDTLSEHGLAGALHLLDDRMTKAGITGNKVGGFLEDAFTKKAGAGLAILLTQMDRFDTKLDVITGAGTSFASKWAATTQTASFAWDSFTASLTASGIEIMSNLLPDLQSAGEWLGKELPTAVSVLSGALGGPLSAAWTVLRAGFEAAAVVLGPILSVLDKFSGPLGDIATLALGVWVAFRLGAAIPAILDGIALRAMYMGDAMTAMKVKAVAALTVTGATAELTASEIALAGGVAATGWRAMLGPLAAAVIGVGLIVSMFHSSSGASKEAATAAKAYTDALKSDGTTGSSVLGTIIKQLSDNNVPELLTKVNDGLSGAAITGAQFVTAISKGGAPLDALRTRLEAIATAGTMVSTNVGRGGGVVATITPQAAAATEALKHLNAQYSGLTSAAKKELEDAKSFGVVATAVDQVSQSMKIGSKQGQTYASMMGILVDSNGIAAASTGQVHDAIDMLDHITGTATQTTSAFVSAWGTFASSAGTSADRAALIGATLKAANGDALNFAAAMNAAAQADAGLVSGLKQSASQIGKNGERVGALVGQIVNLKTGVIDYNNAAAAPLISGLQGMQSAAMAAAQAEYQHARSWMSGKNAADAAYKVYVNQTRGSLIDQAKQLGISTTQAGKLADKYFGMPKKVKTLIESEGGDPVVTILTKIGRMLASIFGVPWNAKLDADPRKVAAAAAAAHAKWVSEAAGIQRLKPELAVINAPALSAIIAVENHWNALHDKTITIRGVYIPPSGDISVNGPQHAAGGMMTPGWSTVGERGWEGAYTDSAGRTTIIPHAAAMAMTGMPDRFPGSSGITSSSARASVPVSRPVSVSAPVTPGMDVSRLERLLEAIDERLARLPDGVASAGAGLYVRGGEANARFLARIMNKGG